MKHGSLSFIAIGLVTLWMGNVLTNLGTSFLDSTQRGSSQVASQMLSGDPDRTPDLRENHAGGRRGAGPVALFPWPKAAWTKAQGTPFYSNGPLQ